LCLAPALGSVKLPGVRYLTSLAAIFAAVCVIVASPAAAGPALPQNKIDALLLSDDDVSSIVGLPVHRIGGVYPSPSSAAPRGDHPECQALIDSDVNVWTGDFIAYRQVTQQDNPDALQFSVRQLVAAYPNSLVLARVFRHTFTSDLASHCRSVTLTTDDGTQWSVVDVSVMGGVATWKLAQLQDGQDTSWRCAFEVQAKGNVMLQIQECQYGNGSPVTAQLADLIASRIPS
jgi:PknH-like protein